MDLAARDYVATVVALASLVTSTLLAVIAFKASKRFQASDADRATRDAWNLFNELALLDEHNLRTADALMSHESNPDDTLEEIRRRWLGYVLINAIADMYLNAVRGHTLSKQARLQTVRLHLSSLMRSEDIYKMTQSGYEEEFTRLCREIRSEVAVQPAAEHAEIRPDPQS